MTAHDRFFGRGQQLPAVFKHKLLVEYLYPFVTMTATRSTSRRVWYVDGYAGPGTYDPPDAGGVRTPGSPLLALNTAEKVRAFSSPVDMRCVFVEADARHAVALETLVSSERYRSRQHRVYKGAIEDSIATIVAQVGADPLLTFLDPFGTALPWALLKESLLGRPSGVVNEVLLNMNIDAVRRIGALPRTEARHQRTIERLDAVLGYQQWRATFDGIYRPGEDGSATRAALAVAQEFRARVGEQTGYSSLAVPVRRGRDHEPIFLMTLFFTHPVALFKYTEAVSLANQEWRHEAAQTDAARRLLGAGNTLFNDDLTPQAVRNDVEQAQKTLDVEWVQAIAATLRRLLAQRSHIPVVDNLAELYGDTFGLAREKHLRGALKILEAEGLTRPVRGSLSRVTIQRAA